MPKNAEFFSCEICNFECSKKSNYNSHILTRKHKNRTNLNENKQEPATKHFSCVKCNKKYMARNSLWYHQQKCQVVNSDNSLENKLCDKDLVIMVMKQQQELMKQNTEFQKKIIEDQSNTQKIMLDVIKNGTHSNNNNSYNKTFNLNVFLNQTCKNAMNLSDFVKSVNVQITDLEKMGEFGYVDGISDIIIKNLKNLEVEKRPMHCTDAKREILYVKDENKWEREEKEKTKIRGAINQVATKNMELLLKYKNQNPECINPNSEDSVKFNQMLIEVLGGVKEQDNTSKVVKRVSKEVILDKI